MKSEASEFIAILSWIRILPSKWELWPTTLNKNDWCSTCLSFSHKCKTKVFRINDLKYKFYLKHFPVWKGYFRGIRMYCQFVLNPIITIKMGTLTHSTQQNWLMWSMSQLFILCENKFFALMISDTNSIWTTFLKERVKSEGSEFIVILSWIRILPSKWELLPTILNKIDWCDPCLSFWYYAKTSFCIDDLRYKYYLNHYPVWKG